jgi:hypothetical protein
MMSITRRYEANYPEALKECFVINGEYRSFQKHVNLDPIFRQILTIILHIISAPKFFSFLYSLMKPLVSHRTMAKIQIYNSNQDKWKRVLLNHIPEDQLPIKLGGTNDGIKVNTRPSPIAN